MLRFATILVGGVKIDAVISRPYRPYSYLAYAYNKKYPDRPYESVNDPLLLLAIEHQLLEEGHLKK